MPSAKALRSVAIASSIRCISSRSTSIGMAAHPVWTGGGPGLGISIDMFSSSRPGQAAAVLVRRVASAGIAAANTSSIRSAKTNAISSRTCSGSSRSSFSFPDCQAQGEQDLRQGAARSNHRGATRHLLPPPSGTLCMTSIVLRSHKPVSPNPAADACSHVPLSSKWCRPLPDEDLTAISRLPADGILRHRDDTWTVPPWRSPALSERKRPASIYDLRARHLCAWPMKTSA